MARVNLQATIDRIDFPEPVWEWLDLLGEMLVATQEEALAHEGYIADDPFKKLMLFGTNRMVGTLSSIYILLRCEHIDLASAQVRVFCEALITLSFVARNQDALAPKFWDHYTVEAFETASALVELERGRLKPEHVRGMERWIEERRPEYEGIKPKYMYVVTSGKDKDKSRPYRNWCNRSLAEQAEDCGGELTRLYRIIYKQLSSYVHCSAFSLRRQAAYSGAHYDVGVVHRDMATLVRMTAVIWVEMAKFLAERLRWDLMPKAAAIAASLELLEERHFSAGQKA